MRNMQAEQGDVEKEAQAAAPHNAGETAACTART